MSRSYKKDRSPGEELYEELQKEHSSKKDKRTYSRIEKKGKKQNQFKGRAYKVRTPSK